MKKHIINFLYSFSILNWILYSLSLIGIFAFDHSPLMFLYKSLSNIDEPLSLSCLLFGSFLAFFIALFSLGKQNIEKFLAIVHKFIEKFYSILSITSVVLIISHVIWLCLLEDYILLAPLELINLLLLIKHHHENNEVKIFLIKLGGSISIIGVFIVIIVIPLAVLISFVNGVELSILFKDIWNLRKCFIYIGVCFWITVHLYTPLPLTQDDKLKLITSLNIFIIFSIFFTTLIGLFNYSNKLEWSHHFCNFYKDKALKVLALVEIPDVEFMQANNCFRCIPIDKSLILSCFKDMALLPDYHMLANEKLVRLFSSSGSPSVSFEKSSLELLTRMNTFYFNLTNDNGELMGCIGIHRIISPPYNLPEMGWRLFEIYHRQGIMTKAMLSYLDYLKTVPTKWVLIKVDIRFISPEQLSGIVLIPRVPFTVIACPLVENTASIKLALKTGWEEVEHTSRFNRHGREHIWLKKEIKK